MTPAPEIALAFAEIVSLVHAVHDAIIRPFFTSLVFANSLAFSLDDFLFWIVFRLVSKDLELSREI